MVDAKNQTALTVRGNNTALRNKTTKVSAIQRAGRGFTMRKPLSLKTCETRRGRHLGTPRIVCECSRT